MLDAQWDFRRARRAYLAAKNRGWMLRRRSCRHPRALSRSTALAPGPSRLEVVSLRAIVGTLLGQPPVSIQTFGPLPTRCAGAGNGSHWRTAKATRVSPVVLRRQPDGYYIVDGRHRVSVARALQHHDIDAWVTGPRR